jgi:hypothetical protein
MGTIIHVENETLIIATHDRTDYMELRVPTSARIALNDKPAKLLELAYGDRAMLRVEWKQSLALATAIEAYSHY